MHDNLRYPIGKFEWVDHPSLDQVEKAIETLANFSQELRKVLKGIDKIDLKKQYRPESWNIAQVIHHLADSHMHSYLRMKHAVLEEGPHIKDYKENDWAHLADALSTDVSYSMDLISALHKRWTSFLKTLTEEHLQAYYFHPERNKKYPVGTTILLYAWHCDHHLAHIEAALKDSHK